MIHVLPPLVWLWLLVSGLLFAVVMHLLCTRSRVYQGLEPLVQALIMLLLQVLIMLLPMGVLALRWPAPWLSGVATFAVTLTLSCVVMVLSMALELTSEAASCHVRTYTQLLLNLTFVIMHQLRALVTNKQNSARIQ